MTGLKNTRCRENASCSNVKVDGTHIYLCSLKAKHVQLFSGTFFSVTGHNKSRIVIMTNT
jgi:hypothetical protein